MLEWTVVIYKFQFNRTFTLHKLITLSNNTVTSTESMAKDPVSAIYYIGVSSGMSVVLHGLAGCLARDTEGITHQCKLVTTQA